MTKAELLDAFKRLAPLASGPFEELALRDAVHTLLGALGLHYQVDAFGNTLVRVRRGLPRSKVGLVVQLDAPAWRVSSVKGAQVTLTPEGPVPARGLVGAALVFGGSQRTGKIATVKQEKGATRVSTVTAKLMGKGDAPEVGSVASFDLEPYAPKAQRLKMRHAFVIASTLSAIDTLATLARQDSACEAWGVFLRAENTRSLGAVAMLVTGLLPRDLTLVTLSGVNTDAKSLGQGPSVRVGDAQGPYDPRATALALGAARALDKAGARALFEADVVSGASTFVAFGHKTTSVALPIANLHNQGAKGVAAEELDLRDVERTTKLLTAICERAGSGIDDLDMVRNELVRGAEEGQKRLRTPHAAGSGFLPELS